MAWYPPAVKKQVNRSRRPMKHPNRVNLHTAVSNSKSMYTFFSGNGVFSHFYIREDGTVEQYQDTALRAACDLDGNLDTISVESWDGYGRVWKGGNPPAWTDAQVAAIVKLIAWIFEAHPSIPKKMATSNRKGSESHGVSWHKLGVPGFMKYARPSGLQYSTSRGKICPGPARIAQIPSIFATAVAAPVPSGPALKPTPPPQKDYEMSQEDTDYIKAQLKDVATKVAYVQAQLRSIADNTYSTEAVKGQTARNAQMVGSIVAAQTEGLSGVILQASKEGGISDAALEKVQERARRGTQQAIDAAEKEASAVAAVFMADLDDLEVMDDDTARTLAES